MNLFPRNIFFDNKILKLHIFYIMKSEYIQIKNTDFDEITRNIKF